jgi:hypothetical protein
MSARRKTTPKAEKNNIFILVRHFLNGLNHNFIHYNH